MDYESPRTIAIDVFPFTVELSTDDFKYIIEAALTHQDDFFENLWITFENTRKKLDEEAAKS